MKGLRRTGVILLGLWLIYHGLLQFVSFKDPVAGFLTIGMAVVAIIAGVLLVISFKAN
jgi:uncharacterized membrane protein YphA (DoxX/SURF4 family)